LSAPLVWFLFENGLIISVKKNAPFLSIYNGSRNYFEK
jgi:hypothetical protein